MLQNIRAHNCIVSFMSSKQTWFSIYSRTQQLNWRVWFWLRLNAGGMPNTCKSNGNDESLLSGDEWRTGEYRVGIYLVAGDNSGKLELIPHNPFGGKASATIRWARVRLACWWGNGSPRLRSVAGLRGWSATLELRHGPDSYGRQQWGILDNGGNPDPAMPRVWWRP